MRTTPPRLRGCSWLFLWLLASANPALAEASARWQALAATLGSELQAAHVPAAALVIVADGDIALLQAFGSATADTPFRVGSITKTFTALAAVTAAHSSATPLDTPLAQLIDPALWRNAWAAPAPVRLGQLIELSAGLADLSGREFSSAKPLSTAAAMALDPASHVTHWAPGLQHSYTNLAPGYTALAVERLAGEPFERYLHRTVLAPLGMPGASLRPLPQLPGGFKADGRTPIPYWHTLFPAFGGLNVSTAEFAVFLRQLARNELPTALQAALAQRNAAIFEPTTTLAAAAGLRFGYGVGMYGSVAGGQVFYGHGGDADGYRSRYAVLPDARRGYYMVINTDNPGLLGGLRRRIEAELARDLPTREAPPAVPFTPAERQAFQRRFAGSYYPASKRFGLADWRTCSERQPRVGIDAQGVYLRRGNRRVPLLRVTGNRFRRAADPVATVVFTEYADRTYLHGELGNYVRVPAASRCTEMLAPPPPK